MSCGIALAKCATVFGAGRGGIGPPPAVSMVNVGGEVPVYKNGTGPNPFELRTIGSDRLIVGLDGDVVRIEIELENLVDPDEPDNGCTMWDGLYNPIGIKRVATNTIGGPITLSCEPWGTVINWIGSAANVGAGAEVLEEPVTSSFNLTFRTLVPLGGVSITQQDDTIEFANTDPGSAVTLASAGGAVSLVNDGIAPSLVNKGITAGAGMSVTDNTTFVTLANTDPGSGVTLANAGAGISIVNDNVGPALAVKSVTQGPGMTLTNSATNVTFTNADPGSAVTLASAGGTVSIVNDGTGAALANKGLTAGSGMSVTDNTTFVTLANTDPGSAVTLASAGGTVSLVNDGTGAALANKGLTAGTGISITDSTTFVTLAYVLSDGSEIVANVNGSDVATSTRLITSRGTMSVQTQVRVNIAAGTQDVKLRFRSIIAGQTTRITNRNVMAQSTLGTNMEVVANTLQSTTLNTFGDVANTTLTLIAGDWIVSWSMQLQTPS